MKTVKNIFVTFFSVIIILLGSAGAVSSFYGIYFLNSYDERFDNIQELSLSIAGAIEETSGLLKDSNDTSRHISESIRITKSSINNASEITYDSGMAFNEIADFMGFEILGFKPLESTEDYFNDIGKNLISLSEDLDTAEDNLELNALDIERIGNDLADISLELKDVSERFNRTIGEFNIYSIVTMAKYIMIYLGILNIIFILNGIIFLSLRK